MKFIKKYLTFIIGSAGAIAVNAFAFWITSSYEGGGVFIVRGISLITGILLIWLGIYLNSVELLVGKRDKKS